MTGYWSRISRVPGMARRCYSPALSWTKAIWPAWTVTGWTQVLAPTLALTRYSPAGT